MKSSAVTAGQQAAATQYNDLRQDAKAASYFLPHEQSSPNMTVRVEDGIAYFGSTLVNFAAANSSALSNPATNPRIDLLVMSTAGALSWVTGTEAVSPSIPSVPFNKMPICAVYLRTSGTTIRDTDQGSGHYIYRDMRRMVISPTDSDRFVSITAQENLTAGQAVGVPIFKSTAARAVLSSQTIAHGIANSVGTARNTHACEIGGDKFVYLRMSTDTSDTLYAQVGTVDTTTNAVTLGTAAAVATAVTPDTTTYQNFCVAKVDTDKFICFYLLDASTTVIKYRVGTVSGTTISFGTEATASTAATTVATGKFMAVQISTGKVAFCYKAPTTTSSKMVVCTVSGTTATFGAEVTPAANTQSNNYSAIGKIGTDKFVVAAASSGSSVNAQVCTVSGTTITAGSEVQIVSTTVGTFNEPEMGIVSPATDVFVVTFSGNTGASIRSFVACTVSGTVPTAGSVVNDNSGVGNRGSMWSTDASTLYCLTSGRAAGATYIHKITLSGTTLTYVLSQRVTGNTAPVVIKTANGNVIGIGNNATVANTYAWMEGMSHTFIGFVKETVSAGQAATVLVKGVDGNQTGLIGGGLYAVSSGGLSFIASTNSISTQEDLYTVRAISDTQVII